ncbi:MAG: transcriptional regulator GutM [Candidatus Actinomarina sp.]|nr:transcriptional regulator GutM [Candidatus Actinomarina sp.]MDG1229416.1 transcriptional regulator GutM [Candidatus Actinomarina sp.]MDG1740009.1 transcriptional regulator GutM [Candidatus Actinomarina sp.]MDG2083059.1 transcriptional regulator GutM [Candidatus Actinomarina sp.]
MALGALFLGLAGMWVLQMQLAKKQAVSFMNVVKELHGDNLTVAIGTNQPKWGRKRVYLAMSANPQKIIVDAITLKGTTVFAKGQQVKELINKSLLEFTDSDGKDPLYDAAAMAADTLIKKINEDSESVSN